MTAAEVVQVQMIDTIAFTDQTEVEDIRFRASLVNCRRQDDFVAALFCKVPD